MFSITHSLECLTTKKVAHAIFYRHEKDKFGELHFKLHNPKWKCEPILFSRLRTDKQIAHLREQLWTWQTKNSESNCFALWTLCTCFWIPTCYSKELLSNITFFSPQSSKMLLLSYYRFLIKKGTLNTSNQAIFLPHLKSCGNLNQTKAKIRYWICSATYQNQIRAIFIFRWLDPSEL